jgi:predicted short-subunit dehydrogenase-like oxidoreductase (DUF2520 family)
MQTLNILGCGKLGRTLAHLWHRSRQFDIRQILNRHPESAHKACEFIGSGRAVGQWQQLQPADVWLIGANDGSISELARQLAETGLVRQDDVVFHCSGALGSDVLSPLSQGTALLASIHPVHSFACANNSLTHFAGSYCACEGNTEALARLRPAFDAIGARTLDIDSHNKPLYHAASVMACNYLVALMDASLECFESAGIEADQASKLLLPLVSQTLTNCLSSSPREALTGPIARGDHATVARQLEALQRHNTHLAELYQTLGRRTLTLARPKLDDERHTALKQLLDPL